MVWIVSTGKKYHKKSTCSNMKGSYQVSLKRAIAMDRGPCKKNVINTLQYKLN